MTRTRQFVGLVVLAIVGMVAAVEPARAQVTTADVIGRVTDTSGGALPGATVTITNPATGDTRTQVTVGHRRLHLRSGADRELRRSRSNWPASTRSPPRCGSPPVTASASNAQLAVGTLTETLTVTAQAPIIQSDSATVGALLPETAVQDLPLNGRNVIGLVRGLPGANEGLPNSLSSGNRPDDRRQTSTVSVNGQNDVVNNNLIDGMDNNERFIGTIGVRPSVDAIAEVKVQTNMYTAETGRTAGAVLNILTKSGTNDFHGSAYGFFRNEKFDAYDYFARRDQPKPLLRQQQWGGSLGGRIVRNRTFFFADYERYNQERGQTWVSTVPTPLMRNGDFSELLARGIVIYDPTTSPRTPFPGNVIPANRIDAIARNFFNMYPLPTAPGLGSNFTTNVTREQTSDTFDVRARPSLHRQPQPLRPLLGQRRGDAGARRVRDRRRHRPGRVGGRLRRPVAGRRVGAPRQLPGDHQADAAVRGQGRQAVLQHRVAARDLSARTSPPRSGCRASTSTIGRRACPTSPWPATRRSATRDSCRSC